MRRRALYRTILLRRTALLGHEDDDGLQDTPRGGSPFGEGGDGREEPTGELHTLLDGEVIEEIRAILVWGCRVVGWGPPVQGLRFWRPRF